MATHRQDQPTATETATGLLHTGPRHQTKHHKPFGVWAASLGAGILTGLAGAAVILGATGFGVAPEPVPAPTMAAPFNTSDPVNYRGSTTAPEGLGPNTLSIPSVGLTMPIEATGSDGKQLIIPQSSTAGLFTGAAPLGASQGSTLIAGHVNFSNGAAAPMALITKIQRGAPIFVTDSSSKVFTFTTDTAASYTKGKLPETFFQTTGPRQLVLISCTNLQLVDGKWEFTGNITVTATPTKQGSK